MHLPDCFGRAWLSILGVTWLLIGSCGGNSDTKDGLVTSKSAAGTNQQYRQPQQRSLNAVAKVSCSVVCDDSIVTLTVNVRIRNLESYPIVSLPNRFALTVLYEKEMPIGVDVSSLAFAVRVHEDSTYIPAGLIEEPYSNHAKREFDFILLPPGKEVLIVYVYQLAGVNLADVAKLRRSSGDGYIPLWPLYDPKTSDLIRDNMASLTYRPRYVLDLSTRRVVGSRSLLTAISDSDFRSLTYSACRPATPVHYKSYVSIRMKARHRTAAQNRATIH
jgi:hypothetical protein